jgi:hypothetical protein
MKPDLLNDIIHDSAYETFREQLLRQIEIEARRKRVARAASWMALAASLAVFFILQKSSPRITPAPSIPVQIVAENPITLKNRPLNPSQILTTRSLSGLVFTTDPQQKLPSISDTELLALFPKKPIGLACMPRSACRFFFIDPSDEQLFMSSN